MPGAPNASASKKRRVLDIQRTVFSPTLAEAQIAYSTSALRQRSVAHTACNRLLMWAQASSAFLLAGCNVVPGQFDSVCFVCSDPVPVWLCESIIVDVTAKSSRLWSAKTPNIDPMSHDALCALDVTRTAVFCKQGYLRAQRIGYMLWLRQQRALGCKMFSIEVHASDSPGMPRC